MKLDHVMMEDGTTVAGKKNRKSKNCAKLQKFYKLYLQGLYRNIV